MLDQLQPSTEQFASPSGLRVRQDLYDEDYSDEDYEQMLSMYEGTMAQIVEAVEDNGTTWFTVSVYPDGHAPLDTLLEQAWANGAADAIVVRD